MIKLIWKGGTPPTENREKYIWINGNEYKVWNGIDWEDLPLSTDEKIDERLLPDSIVRKSELSTLIEDLGIHSGTDGKDGTNGKDGQAGQDGKDGQDGQDGINGRDGVDGQDGQDGLGIKDQFDYYLTTNSTNIDGTEPVDEYPVAEAYDVWQKEFVTNVTEDHQYLWHRIKTIYTDDTTIKISAPVIIRHYVDFDSSALEEEVNTIIDNKIQDGDFDEPIESVISEGLSKDGNITAAIVSAKEDAITQAVTTGSKIWVKYYRENTEEDWKTTGDVEPITKQRNELLPVQDTNLEKWVQEFTAKSISGINIRQDRITSAILDENSEVKAGIDIIGDAATEPNGHGGSRIIITADNVNINGALTAESIKSKLIDTDKLTADSIDVDSLEVKHLNAADGTFKGTFSANVTTEDSYNYKYLHTLKITPEEFYIGTTCEENNDHESVRIIPLPDPDTSERQALLEIDGSVWLNNGDVYGLSEGVQIITDDDAPYYNLDNSHTRIINVADNIILKIYDNPERLKGQWFRIINLSGHSIGIEIEPYYTFTPKMRVLGDGGNPQTLVDLYSFSSTIKKIEYMCDGENYIFIAY